LRKLGGSNVPWAQEHWPHALLKTRQVNDCGFNADIARTTFKHRHALCNQFRKLVSHMGGCGR
jgi:hypothetical protein